MWSVNVLAVLLCSAASVCANAAAWAYVGMRTMHLVVQCQLYDDLRSQFMELFGDIILSRDVVASRQVAAAVMNPIVNTKIRHGDVLMFRFVLRSMAAFLCCTAVTLQAPSTP